MSTQAQNSMQLYKGGSPAKIEQLLRIQKKSVVDELHQHFGTTSLTDLAVKLSIG